MNKNLPIYDILIDDFDETGVDLISIVKDPAIECKGVRLSKEILLEVVSGVVNSSNVDSYKYNTNNGELILTFNDGSKYKYTGVDLIDYENIVLGDATCITEGENEFGSWWEGKNPSIGAAVWKYLIDRNVNYQRLTSQFEFSLQEEKKKLLGPALIPDLDIYRRDDDGYEYYIRFSKDVIEQIVNKFFKSGTTKKINFNHSKRMVDAYISSSWIKESENDKSKDYGFDLPIGTWFVELKVEDDKFWTNEVKSQGFYSFSIEGILGLEKVNLSANIYNVIDSIEIEDLKEIWNYFNK